MGLLLDMVKRMGEFGPGVEGGGTGRFEQVASE